MQTSRSSGDLPSEFSSETSPNEAASALARRAKPGTCYDMRMQNAVGGMDLTS
jgi:hypothetical protein